MISPWLTFTWKDKFNQIPFDFPSGLELNSVFPDSQVGAYLILQCNMCFITCFTVKGEGVERHGCLHPQKYRAQNTR